MILADKIISLRKKNGWSQEDFAEKMNVSRQAVSKWESAQSVPDLEKILKMSEMFGVTTDYLLKDDKVEEEYTDAPDEAVLHSIKDGEVSEIPIRRVTMAEANEYLALRAEASKKISLGVLLCIAAPIFLLASISIIEIILGITSGGTSAVNPFIGIVGMLVLVAVAVILFITVGNKCAHFAFLDTEPFETEYGVSGMVKERQKQFSETYSRFNLIGVVMCVLSPVLLFAGTFFRDGNLVLLMICLMLAVVGAAVYMFVRVGVVWASMQRLLGEGEFSAEKKQRSAVMEAVSTAYWLTATAVYLAWSFIGNAWDISWVTWVVAALIYAGFMIVMNLPGKRKV